MKLNLLKYFAMAVLAAVSMPDRASGATIVGLELSLLVDKSGSVDNSEFLAQRNGYAAAFNSSAIHALITTLAAQNGGKGLAVNYIQWDASPAESIKWTLLNNAADSIAFASTILATPRNGNSGTGVANAINFATPLFFSNEYDGVRKVIDVSGDGADNQSAPGATLTAGNNAIAAGIDRINGLPILGESGLLSFYQTEVQHGPNSFTLEINSFADFAPAIERKLSAEIRGTTVPEGGPGPVVGGLLLFGLAAIHKQMQRRKSA